MTGRWSTEIEPQIDEQGTQNGEVKRIPFKSSFLRHSAVPCSILCGSLPVRSPFPVTAYPPGYPDALAESHLGFDQGQ